MTNRNKICKEIDVDLPRQAMCKASVKFIHKHLLHQKCEAIIEQLIILKRKSSIIYVKQPQLSPYHASDPNNEVPKWELTFKPTVPTKANDINPYYWRAKKGKRDASESPKMKQRRKKGNVNIWQVAEFLHSFLEGMATKPVYTDLDREDEARNIKHEEMETGEVIPDEVPEVGEEPAN